MRRGDQPWLDRELGLVSTSCAWGVGFLTWGATETSIARALEFGPSAVLLSFGDPEPFLPVIREAGAAVVLQVGDLESARRAVDLGADVIVAQGVESGGHGWSKGRGTMAFVPVVVDLAGSIPVLAAGGIADGRGVAAALALGVMRRSLIHGLTEAGCALLDRTPSEPAAVAPRRRRAYSSGKR